MMEFLKTVAFYTLCGLLVVGVVICAPFYAAWMDFREWRRRPGTGIPRAWLKRGTRLARQPT